MRPSDRADSKLFRECVIPKSLGRERGGHEFEPLTTIAEGKGVQAISLLKHQLARLIGPQSRRAQPVPNGIDEHKARDVEDLLSQMRAASAEIILPCGDHVLRIPPDNFTRWIVGAKNYQRDIFERAISVAEARGRLRPGGVMLDIGANIGFHTLYAHLSGRFERVVSVEASARNFRFLEINVRENGLANKTSMIHCAGGRAAGIGRLNIDPKNGLRATLTKPREQAEQVEIRPIEAILADLQLSAEDVSMSWIDVTGFEVEVLAGMREVIAAGQPLALEFAESFFDAGGRQEMFDLLNQGPYSEFIEIKGETGDRYALAELPKFSSKWTNLLFL